MAYPDVMLHIRSRARAISMAITVSATAGLLLYAYLFFSETGRFPTLENVRGFVWSFFIGAVTGVVIYFLNHWLDTLLNWRNQFAARFLAGYLSSVIVAASLVVAFAFVTARLADSAFIWTGFSLQDEDLLWKVIILLLTALFLYKIIYSLLYSYQQYAVAQIETLQRERKQLELQFEALKSQISPHYLFNSLNTISSLIYKDQQSAEQFIRRLAQTYQYILSTQHKPFVLLKEEIDFVQSYYYLLRIRFQQQLNVEINVPSSIMHTKIPPLTLQILVENAVKHNPLSADKKLFIYISSQDNTHLRVMNTKTGEMSNVQSFRVGLENIQKRYEFFTHRKIEIRDEDKFMVSLPVIYPKKERAEQRYSA